MKKRVYYTYDFKVGNTVVYQGITRDPKRREQDHKQRWQDGASLSSVAAKPRKALANGKPLSWI